MTDNLDDLLTIKQAAKMLNVSEMSLRRWTNSGKLACLRIGAHRTRRFRRSDLVQFLERQDSPEPKVTPSIVKKQLEPSNKHVLLEGMVIEYGNHLCSFYDNLTGCLKLSVPLIIEGLNQGDVCFLIASPKTQKTILAGLTEANCDVETAIKTGQLIVSAGEANKAAMLKTLLTHFTKTTRSGSQLMRLVGDMSWCLEQGWDVSEILEYETVFDNTLGRQYPVVALCQYDVADFSGEGVLGALRCHEDTFKYPLNRFLGTAIH